MSPLTISGPCASLSLKIYLLGRNTNSLGWFDDSICNQTLMGIGTMLSKHPGVDSHSISIYLASTVCYMLMSQGEQDRHCLFSHGN